MEDDMEMTKCQAIIIESKSVGPKPFGKSNKRLSLMPASDIRSDINSKEDMKKAHKLSGHRALNRFSLSELPDCMDIHEPSVFGISAVQDDMDLTGCRTVTIDTKNTSLAGASRIMAQKTPCSSSSRCAVLDEDQMEMTEVVSEKPENVILSQTTCKPPIAVMDVEAGNLVDSHKEPWIHMDLIGGQAALIDPNKSEVSCLSIVKKSSSVHLIAENAESSENDCDMEITGAFTAPFEQQCYVDFKKEDITKENAETLSGTTDQTTIKEGDVKKAVICEDFATESAFVVKNDQLKSAKSRRRSLADLQHKLQTIAHSINEPNGLLLGSHTAPIPNFTVSERCPIDEHSERPSSTESLNGTPTLKNVSSATTERTAPFNLKNFLTARLSLGGATPKLPSRTKSASPNQTESISNNKFENLFLETQLDGRIQSSSCVISMIDNEVLPEEDLSDTMVSYVSNKKHVQHDSTVVPSAEVAAEDDVNLSQSEKIPCDIEDAGDIKRQEASEKWGNNSAAAGVQNVSSIMSKMIDDTSSMASVKCDGIAESSLRNSQFDSQIDGTTDHEFDFSKTFEDGSITVNEFLSHFGANTVIHKSRPSALPDNFRVATTHSMEDLLKEKYIFHSKQRVYEADTQKLSEMVEGFKTQLAEQYKALREINGTLLQDMCAFSNEQLQKFGAKLKERRVYFRKRSKQLSHEMKHVLYSELIKTTQDSKQNLVTKIKETNEMLQDLDGCVNDLESDLAAVNSVLMGDQQCLIGAEPAMKAKQKDLDALNSEVAETEKQICDQEHQRVVLVSTQEKLQDEAIKLESHITTLNSLNEWRFCEQDENRTVFAFLHNTVHLEVKLKKPSEDAEQGVDVSFKFLLNGESSEPHADLIHRLLGYYIQTQTQWMQKYPTTQSVPVLLHDVSLVVSRLRLLGEEIHQLKKWGGLRLGILRITCVDTLIEILFSSVKAFAKFELSLAVTPDYPFRPLQLQKFQNHIGNARADQIKDILCSVTPSKNYLTKVIKKIHADILG
ncbi:hypothetical protein NFI96_022256 [Prochilodus magdalenae]|nr:hypothetical protein NFI96_022256 [Prochilodus magdalenae]